MLVSSLAEGSDAQVQRVTLPQRNRRGVTKSVLDRGEASSASDGFLLCSPVWLLEVSSPFLDPHSLAFPWGINLQRGCGVTSLWIVGDGELGVSAWCRGHRGSVV